MGWIKKEPDINNGLAPYVRGKNPWDGLECQDCEQIFDDEYRSKHESRGYWIGQGLNGSTKFQCSACLKALEEE